MEGCRPVISSQPGFGVVADTRKLSRFAQVNDSPWHEARLLGIDNHIANLLLAPRVERVIDKRPQQGVRLAVRDHFLLHDRENLVRPAGPGSSRSHLWEREL